MTNRDRKGLKPFILWLISGFQRTAPLWAITQRVVTITYWRFGTTYRFHLQEMAHDVRIDRLSISVGKNYHYSLRNSPEERSSRLLYYIIFLSFWHPADSNSVLVFQWVHPSSSDLLIHRNLILILTLYVRFKLLF